VANKLLITKVFFLPKCFLSTINNDIITEGISPAIAIKYEEKLFCYFPRMNGRIYNYPK
jgi:hypothetical protein